MIPSPPTHQSTRVSTRRYQTNEVVTAQFVPVGGEDGWLGPSGSALHPAGYVTCTAPAMASIGTARKSTRLNSSP